MTDQSSKPTETVVDIEPKEGQSEQKPVSAAHVLGELRHNPEQIKDLFRSGRYPYKTKIRAGVYQQHKEELQVELLKVQNWVKQTGERIVVLCRRP